MEVEKERKYIMIKVIKKAALVIAVTITILNLNMVLAHGGRTDSSGGHRDNKNASGLGSYHYHHGEDAHLHPNGVCPYDSSSAAVEETTPVVNTVYTAPKVENILNFKEDKMEIDAGEESKIEVNTNMSYIKYSTSDETIATVDDNGVVKAIKDGQVVITVGNTELSKTVSVTVKGIPVTSITTDIEEVIVSITEIKKVNVTLEPSNATNKEVSYTIENPEVAIVTKEGDVIGNNFGETKLIISTPNGITKEISVEVRDADPFNTGTIMLVAVAGVIICLLIRKSINNRA